MSSPVNSNFDSNAKLESLFSGICSVVDPRPTLIGCWRHSSVLTPFD